MFPNCKIFAQKTALYQLEKRLQATFLVTNEQNEQIEQMSKKIMRKNEYFPNKKL